MTSKKDLMEASLVVKRHGNPDIFLSSKRPDIDNNFYIVFKNEIIGSVYSASEKWYIWDRRKKYRLPVKDFTTALTVIEGELCVA